MWVLWVATLEGILVEQGAEVLRADGVLSSIQCNRDLGQGAPVTCAESEDGLQLLVLGCPARRTALTNELCSELCSELGELCSELCSELGELCSELCSELGELCSGQPVGGG